MGRTEGVVHVEVRQIRQRLGELGIVGLLLAVKAQILEQDQLTGAQLADGVVHARTERIAGHADRASKQLREPVSDGLETQRVVDLALWTTQVARQDHARAALQQVADGGNAGANPRVVGDPPIVERYVEIGSQEDALAADVDVANRLLVHGGRGATHRRAAM